MCWSKKPVKKLQYQQWEDDTDSDNSDEYNSHKISIISMSDKTSLMRLRMNNTEGMWQPDTGTKKDIMDTDHLAKYEEKHGECVNLKRSNIKLYAYGATNSLTLISRFDARLQAG